MEHLEGLEGEEKNKIGDNRAVEGEILSSKDKDKTEKRFLDTRLIALFIIGALVGITLKTHAIQSVTMGFEDYKLQNLKSDFGLSPDEEEVVEETELIEGIEEESVDAENVIIEEDVSENQE